MNIFPLLRVYVHEKIQGLNNCFDKLLGLSHSTSQRARQAKAETKLKKKQLSQKYYPKNTPSWKTKNNKAFLYARKMPCYERKNNFLFQDVNPAQSRTGLNFRLVHAVNPGWRQHAAAGKNRAQLNIVRHFSSLIQIGKNKYPVIAHIFIHRSEQSILIYPGKWTSLPKPRVFHFQTGRQRQLQHAVGNVPVRTFHLCFQKNSLPLVNISFYGLPVLIKQAGCNRIYAFKSKIFFIILLFLNLPLFQHY